MDFEVARDDLHRTRWHEAAPPALEPGEARLRVDRFALTSNNVTYAVFGDAMRYWDFFPTTDPSTWGRVPVWGFADVVESTVPVVVEGDRLYGYLPMSTELVVSPTRTDERGFVDGAAHRAPMAAAYNRYLRVEADAIYRREREGLQMVLWPLFFTSFVLDDALADEGFSGASQVVLSSASSKTAIGTAFLLAERDRVDVVGMTSAGNAPFVGSLGCYDRVVTYDRLDDLGGGTTVYVDLAGDASLTRQVHERCGADLASSTMVGGTHWEAVGQASGAEPLPGPAPQLFFAPTQIAKRSEDWGRQVLDERVGAAWDRFTAWASGWLELRSSDGPEEVEATYRALLDGQVDPSVGHVCSLG